ncbi:MAG: M14 family metallopeptidase [Candidatus Thermoplasmatota archaeon]|nr:M14 family metallopeptidase [Candidatus Thermoplasmatota archaeon]
MKSNLAAAAIFMLLLVAGLAGCIQEPGLSEKSGESQDLPMVLPDWKDDVYHNYEETKSWMFETGEKYPQMVEVFSIGTSVQDRELWCMKITDENDTGEKMSCLIDGCTHGDEWEATEFCLYFTQFLLENYGKNGTATGLVGGKEIYVIPIVNPDGREADTRHNANSVNINRNYDIDWGNPEGSSIIDPMGLTGHTFENCGPEPFSEPETCAMRDFMETLHNKNFAFYMPCHTANHALLGCWSCARAPFEMPQRDYDLIEHTFQWVRDHTEYEAGRTQWLNETGGQPMPASGTAGDWCYMRHGVASFTMELSQGSVATHANLTHWMKATLPVGMYMLANAENFLNWRTPDITPIFPEGTPPRN